MVRDKTMQQKNKQASALVVSMIILGLILSIALSVSLVSILENKASTGSSKSNLAYSRADTGVEAVLQAISANIGGTINAIDGNCDGIIAAADGKYEIELKDGDDKIISTDNGYDCSSEKISTIDVIKSTGITSTNQRSVEVAVAAGSDILKGYVNKNGSIDRGTGFTVEKLGAGKYKINFTSPYPSVPVVLATTDGGQRGDHIQINYTTTTSVTIDTLSYDTNGGDDAAFGFAVFKID
jgi:uncharacterized protein YegP (UPF0339 family)